MDVAPFRRILKSVGQKLANAQSKSFLFRKYGHGGWCFAKYILILDLSQFFHFLQRALDNAAKSFAFQWF